MIENTNTFAVNKVLIAEEVEDEVNLREPD